MSQLTDQTERQAYNAIMAARAGSPDALSSQLERQIYAAIVAAGDGGGGGTPGQAATVTVGTTTTLPPGSQATVTNSGTTSAAVLNFGVPQGEKGEQGQQGIQGPTGPVGPAGSDGENAVAALTPRGDYTASAEPAYVVNDYVSYKGNSYACKADNPKNIEPTTGDNEDPYWQLMALQGARGDDGTAATITIGTVTTLSPGSQATVTNTGTANAANLNFGLPAGTPGGGAELNTFSLQEQLWGTWIDGKTIYRKIFTNLAYGADGTFTAGNPDISALNIDAVLRIDGLRTNNNGIYAPMSGGIYAFVSTTDNELRSTVQTGTTVGVGEYVWIALYYTKKA